MSDARPFLLYGATGYTGALIAELCAQRAIPVVLAGRSASSLQPLAERLKLPFVVAGLDDATALDRALLDASCVLHCAGPFSRTSRPMVDACLRTGRSYLDITGEIDVFEALAKRSNEAVAKGITLLPGVGFDVVPSDCMAAHVKRRLPAAVKLQLGLSLSGSSSHGTSATILEGAGSGLGGVVRENGVLVRERTARRSRSFDFGDAGTRVGVSMAWGDVSTAFHSTQIPNVEVYFAFPRAMRIGLALSPLAAPFLRSKSVRGFLESRIPTGGPDAAARARGRSVIVADAVDAAGRHAVSRLTAPDGYAVTTETALLSVARVQAGGVKPGFLTPSLAFGPDFILAIAGVSRTDV